MDIIDIKPFNDINYNKYSDIDIKEPKKIEYVFEEINENANDFFCKYPNHNKSNPEQLRSVL